MFDDALKSQSNAVSQQIIGATIEAHRFLGPGLLESAYEECLCRELELRGISFQCQVPVPLVYKGLALDCGYRLDLLVSGLVIVELKTANEISPIFEAQLITYLRLTNHWLGLIINFHEPVLKDGIRQRVLG